VLNVIGPVWFWAVTSHIILDIYEATI
jgi:hypothetical protein